MMHVERHQIKGTPEIIRLCSASKDLYNKCCFLMRRAWSRRERSPDINVLVNSTKDSDCFKNLHNTKTAKQTVRQVLTDWANYKKALIAFNKNPSKFVKKPRPPGYKEKLAQVIFYNETILKKPARKGFLIPTNKCFEIKSNKPFKQVVITPKRFGFIVEVQYEIADQEKPKLDKKKFASVDVGLNNLLTIASDQHSPILVNGRMAKSFNQWFNKNPSKSRSSKRYFRLENYFHHVSKFLVQNCVKYGIGTLVIGKNDGWKQEMNLGRKTNQNFQYIPFHLLFEKIKYKAEMVGLEVVFTEESYTSKASFLDNDPLPEYKKGIHPVFSGKRKHRGLYVSKDGFALNADVNGALNIARKVFQKENIIPELSARTIGDRSLAARPARVNVLKHPKQEKQGKLTSKPDDL